jgi:hypothetical protein
MQQLAAMELAEDLEDAGYFATGEGFGEGFLGAAQECAEIAVLGVLQREQPSMCGLILMQTCAGTLSEWSTRCERYTCPKPPSPSSRSMRYRSCVSGLVTIWSGSSSSRPRASGATTDRVRRVVPSDEAATARYCATPRAACKRRRLS